MQSWVGTCITTGCAIGATGLVLFHYIRKENQNNAYMLTKEEWAQGVVDGFNKRLSLAAKKSNKLPKYYVESDEVYWYERRNNIVKKYENKGEIKNFFEQLDPTVFRDDCISALADLYRDKGKMDKLLKDDVSVLQELVTGVEGFTLRHCLHSDYEPNQPSVIEV